MAQTSESYMATMNSPLRPETSVRILITNQDADNPPPVANTVSIEFVGKDILELEEYYDTDPISRDLPRHTLKFSVIDTNRNLQEKYDWESLRCRAYVFYKQYYIPGLQYSWYTDAPERHTFYIKNATTAGQVTTFQCQDVIGLLSGYSLSEKVSPDATVPDRGRITDEIIKYPPPGIKLSVNSMPRRSIQTLQPYYKENVSILLQKLMNPMGFIRVVAGHGGYKEKPSNAWQINCWDNHLVGQPNDKAYVLSINNVYKDSIQRITSPSISEITCTTKTIEILDYGTWVVDVTGETTGNYYPNPDEPIINSYQVVEFDKPLLNVKVSDGMDKVRRFEQKTLYEGIVYWNKNLDNVSPKPNIILEGTPVFRLNRLRRTKISGVPQGTTENFNNPYIDDIIFSNFGREPYIYRNVLKMKFRGDFTFAPGIDTLWFEYAPGRRIPCQVISNKIIVKQTMRGELALRILLTDAEIKRLNPLPASQKAELASQETVDIDKSEPFTEEVAK